ncbi:MAG: hypothetical protein HQL96_04040 [Magnetococcales bacterium]|nr:hypothetical protein [Magnetococcales bacterium]
MAELPGKQAHPGLQDPKGRSGGKEAQPELTLEADQITQLHSQLLEEEQLVMQTKLEQQRLKREQELQKGKPKKIEKIDVASLKFAKEERRGGLPDRIRKLPKDHPLRVLFEKGLKQQSKTMRSSGQGRAQSWTREDTDNLKDTLKVLSILILLVGLIAGLYYGSQQYQSTTGETRQKILAAIKEKNYRPDHPKVDKEFKALYWSNWLPDLQKLLDFINGLGMNYEVFDGNPEPGSYTDYIKRHNKPFNQADALEWYAREIRKPSWVNNP